MWACKVICHNLVGDFGVTVEIFHLLTYVLWKTVLLLYRIGNRVQRILPQAKCMTHENSPWLCMYIVTPSGNNTA